MQLPEDLLRMQTNPFGEIFFPEISQDLFTKYPAMTVLKESYESAFVKEGVLYLIMGSDSGHLPSYLKQRFQAGRGGRRFVIFEFAEISQSFVDSLPEWIQVVPANQSLDFIAQQPKLNDFLVTRDISHIESISIAVLKKQHPLFAWKEERKQAVINLASNLPTALPFETQTLQNLVDNVVPIREFQGKLHGYNALIVGAGPSVDDHIEWICDHQERLVIFAAARSVKRLRQCGIQVDFIVSVDPHELSYDNSKHFLVDANVEQTILLHSSYINHRLLSQWQGKSVYIGVSTPWASCEWNSEPAGPTVMHASLYQAAYMGCSQIFMVGVDMCYQQDKTHISGSAENELGKFFVQHLTSVTTYRGEQAATSQAFSQGVKSLEIIANSITQFNPETSIFNLSLDAAKVPGIAYQDPLACQLSLEESKQGILINLSDKAEVSLTQRKAHIKQVIQELKGFKAKLSKTLPILKQGRQQLDKVKEFNQSEGNRLINLKVKAEKNLGADIYHYLMHTYKNHAILKNVLKESDNEMAMTEDEIRLRLASFFDGLKEVCLSQQVLLNKALKVAEFRLQECSPTSRPSQLLKGWTEFEVFNRVEIWQQNFGHHVELTPENDAAICSAREQFLVDINTENTAHKEYLESIGLSFEELARKLVNAFEHQNLKEVNELLQQSERLPDSEKLSLQALITAVVADLQNHSTAESYYKTALQYLSDNFFILKRLLHFSMQQQAHEEVLLYLEKLVAHSIDYMVSYADYLAMLGQNQFAFQLLFAYLQQKPDKVKSWMRLSELALKLGSQMDAKIALEKALEIEPENTTIQQMLAQMGVSNG